jgi:hypothetical protein
MTKAMLKDAIDTLIQTRDFMGNEAEALNEWEHENGDLTTDQWEYVLNEVENKWEESRKKAKQ